MLYFKTIKNFLSDEPGSKNITRHNAGLLLLQYAILNEFGIKINKNDIVIGEYGKPYLKGRNNIHFNISHSGPFVAVILSRYQCGIDIEMIRSIDTRVYKRVCTANEIKAITSSAEPEQCFTTFWTLKESYVKAIGRGLSFGMKNIEFDLNPDGIKSNQFGTFSTFKESTEYGNCIISVCELKNTETGQEKS